VIASATPTGHPPRALPATQHYAPSVLLYLGGTGGTVLYANSIFSCSRPRRTWPCMNWHERHCCTGNRTPRPDSPGRRRQPTTSRLPGPSRYHRFFPLAGRARFPRAWRLLLRRARARSAARFAVAAAGAAFRAGGTALPSPCPCCPHTWSAHLPRHRPPLALFTSAPPAGHILTARARAMTRENPTVPRGPPGGLAGGSTAQPSVAGRGSWPFLGAPKRPYTPPGRASSPALAASGSCGAGLLGCPTAIIVGTYWRVLAH
jgi:hypothetical protein